MIKINLENNILILTYFPESPWVLDKLGLDGEATLKKTFTFSSGDLVSSSDQEEESGIKFILGSRVGDYFKIESRILDIRHNIFFHKNMNFSEKFFIAYKSTSIFKNIDRLVSEDLYIGGDLPGSFPETEFTCLIKEFPNGYEIQKYVDARLGAVLSNYFESTSNLEEKYNLYMNKRKSIKGLNLPKTFRTEEVAKYKTILEKLETMLEAEDSYNEKRWQEEITQIILLLYPKYIAVLNNVCVKNTYEDKNKFIDILLTDSDGNIDIIEIKRPFDKKIITEGTYRDNHIPLRELSGTVMQIEKYIYHLNKWGKKGEDTLTKKYETSLPKNFKLKITNPCGLIIMGRDNNLSPSQRGDFETVKRKYRNIVDIITYDDLLRRLKFIIETWQSR